MTTEKVIGDKLIFVGGAPRSGTSITQAVLDSHHEIYGGPEFDRMPDIVEARNKLIDSIKFKRIDMLVSNDQVDNAFGHLIESLLYPVKDKYNKKYLSEKTPANVLVFKELIEILPGAKFIHVVRDPRAVINSMLQVSERHYNNGVKPPDFIADLNSSQNTVKKYVDAGYKASLLNPDRVYTLIYELLILEPEKTTKSLCQFLEIDWSEEMLHPGEKEHTAEKLFLRDGGLWTDGKDKFSNPDPKILTKWTKTLHKDAATSISNLFGNFEIYKAIGYEFN